MMRHSQRVFEPVAVPLCSTFEDAGLIGAVKRLLIGLAVDCGHAFVDTLPVWIWSLDFKQAVVECKRGTDTGEVVYNLRTQTRRFKRGVKEEVDASMDVCTLSETQKTATVRLAFGELLEAHAAHRALLVCGENEVPIDTAERKSLATIYSDSYLISVWTSAHAEFLATIHDLAGSRHVTEAVVQDFMVPIPELYSIINLSNLLDLSALYERILSPRCCAKSAQPLLAILTRATNAGSRGWESTLHAAAKESDGAVRVCMQALGVAFAGLNPCIHPAARRDWRTRFVILRLWRAQNQGVEFKELVNSAPGAIKEAVRLHLSGVLTEDCATLGAFLHTQQPSGQLGIPPMCLPPSSMISAMQAFVEAGADLASPTTTGTLPASRTIAALVLRHLTSEPRSRKKPKTSSARSARSAKASRMGGSCQSVEILSYYASWLGGRSGPASSSVRPATVVISGLLSASFRANYVPFWLHAQHHGHRAARLDASQYTALHHNNPSFKLCSLLPIKTIERIQTLAMSTNTSSLLTVTQACALLGIETRANATPSSPVAGLEDVGVGVGLPCTTSSRSIQEAEMVFMSLNAVDAATLIVFTRICSLRSQMLSYDLGDSTRRLQAESICKRLLVIPHPGDTAEKTTRDRLPDHATYLFACSECKRVVNACQEFQGKDTPFNEIGLSASMLAITGEICDGHMRCAKRSSAALRTAVSLEAAAESLEIETYEIKTNPRLPPDLRPSSIVNAMCETKSKKSSLTDQSEHDSSSEVAKFRRDVKNSFEQHARAVSCGDVPLVRIPILGRIVRIFGDWLGICSFCGCLSKILPTSRFRGDICCMRCDFGMLVGKKSAAEMDAALPKPPPPSCRFCGKVQPENCSGAKWRKVDAPVDTGGKNATVPPPLRVCYYCPSHYRAWLPSAHRTMGTNEIFAHLVAKARPMHGANTTRSAGAAPHSHTGTSAGPSTDNDIDLGNSAPTAPAPKKSAQARRKLALSKQIAKNNRRNRLVNNVYRAN